MELAVGLMAIIWFNLTEGAGAPSPTGSKNLTNSSSGNIVDLVNQLDKDHIDLTCGADSGQAVANETAEVAFDFNLQFITECFPNFEASYCRDWLRRYNGDLVKTCDYLSRCSQTEDLPAEPDVIKLDAGMPDFSLKAESAFLIS